MQQNIKSNFLHNDQIGFIPVMQSWVSTQKANDVI